MANLDDILARLDAPARQDVADLLPRPQLRPLEMHVVCDETEAELAALPRGVRTIFVRTGVPRPNHTERMRGSR